MRKNSNKVLARSLTASSAIFICAAVAILSLSGCSKSNPVIGKWKLAPNADPSCAALDNIEFTDTSMTLNVLTKQTFPITYSQNGDQWVVNGTPTGPITFEKESGGIKSVAPECHLVPNS